MGSSALLDLSVLIKESISTNLQDLLDEVNLDEFPDYPVPFPKTIMLGVRVEMLQKNLDDLPVLAVGVYDQNALEAVDGEGFPVASAMVIPYIIDIYCGEEDPEKLYIFVHKYAIALKRWAKLYASTLYEGFLAEESPDITITYALTVRGGYRQLVSLVGTFVGVE